ncbi:MAG: uroporphyrinogen-III synthase [Caldilineae bacterium]|nr:MAG: uroporphyrinogen-III synthase [Caldilineae bacterium]
MKPETRNLHHKRILVTRAAGQNETLRRLLEAEGAEVVEFPTIQITPPDDPAPLHAAIAGIDRYHWLAFTSANGVRFFWRALEAAGKRAAGLRALRIAAVGPATAGALRALGVTVACLPARHTAEALAAAMGDVAGQRILFPAADIARPALETALQAKGAIVERVTAYQTRPVTDAGDLPALLPTLDALTFTSPSTVQNFVALLETDAPANATGGAVVACIGPTTAAAAEAAGLPVHLIAQPHTAEGLVQSLSAYYTNT